MKLSKIRVRNFRSFLDRHEFDVSNGVNYLVGPNNCGKSNLISALELALDPDAVFDPERDRPASSQGVGAPPQTRITLTFDVGTSGPERTLLKRAKEYEVEVRRSRNPESTVTPQTYAEVRQIRFVTSFGADCQRQTSFQAKGAGATTLPADSEVFQRLESQFRKVLRFAVVHSGEDLESLLNGKFREILSLVIRDHLGEQLKETERERSEYVNAIEQQLLDPLRAQVGDRVAELFPEITVASLVPDVLTISETLSSVDVRLEDAAESGLKGKGTGVRGAVLVSMLQYLAEQSRRSLVLAVEEPEAFLHPGAQEQIREQLEQLAQRSEVSLIVTTHSPYVISRRADARITELHKDGSGNTVRQASASGTEDHAELLGSLYRDAGMAGVLERALRIPPFTRAILITEGYTDKEFLRIACKAATKSDLLKGIHMIQADGAKKVVVQAILARSATEVPIVALLDKDDNGNASQKKLEDFGWSKSREILNLRDWPDACPKGHDVEIEDLIPAAVSERIVRTLGEINAVDGKSQCNGAWHYRFSEEWKKQALQDLPGLLQGRDTDALVWLAEEINRRIDKIDASKVQAAAHTARTGAHQT